MTDLQTQLSDTLDMFTDLQHLYYYKEDDRGTLKKIYENALFVLDNPEIDVLELVDEKGNNLLHLASDAFNVEFFIKAARKGINPYETNKSKRNAFHSRHYDFANSLWKKFEHIYFDSQIVSKSFSEVTKGFHVSFKQAIYENNIRHNGNSYDLKEVSQFLKENNLYSHKNVLLFAYEKINGSMTELLDFVTQNKEELTPEENSLALHCALRFTRIKSSKMEMDLLLDLFVNEHTFSIDENFLQSMKFTAEKYDKSSFQNIFHKQTQILVDNNYKLKKKFNFYFEMHYMKKDKQEYSIDNLSQLYKVLSLEPVWNYYHIHNKLNSTQNEAPKIKKPKI